MQQALYHFCLRLADNNLILAQRLAEWCSRGPILEEDLAMTNISLDLFGEAESLYEYAASINNNGKTADDLAFLRVEREFSNNLLVEQPNGDFASTMLRQMLFSVFAKYIYEQLSKCNNEDLQGLSLKFLKEIKYHIRHSSEWVIRLGNGTDESRTRLTFALNELWRYTADMFVGTPSDEALVDAGISIDLNYIKEQWKFTVKEILTEAGLEIPDYNNEITGGALGKHTEHLGHILSEMQYLQRAHPGAQW